MTDFKVPREISRAIVRFAPRSDYSENYGRRGDYLEEPDECSVGYESILIYIQLGLSEYRELIHEIVKLIIVVQNDYYQRYTIIPAAFGRGREFVSDKKYFEMAFIWSNQAHRRIADVIAKLSGNDKSEVPAVIPAFFQKTDIRSLYYGKTSFERNDLMVIIGKKSEVFFDANLEDYFLVSMKKQILFVEIDENSVNWIFRNFQPEFI